MIIFLYGQDTYRSREKLKEIVEHYKEVHKSGLNLKLFEGKNFDYQDFRDIFQQTSMFQEKKLIILKDIFQNQELKDAFLENSQKFIDSKDIIVFQEEGEISAKDAFFKFLAKNAKTQEFGYLDDKNLKSWARKEFKKYNSEVQPEAIGVLVNRTGNDLWRLACEIKKLAAFKNNQAVEARDINTLVKPEIETDIFATIEALALRDKKKAVSLIHEHLEKGDSPLYLLSMINFQFRNLLVVKKTGKLSAHPYFVQKMAFLSRSFTFEELKKIYYRIFEADLKIKTGQIDPQTALDLLIAEV